MSHLSKLILLGGVLALGGASPVTKPYVEKGDLSPIGTCYGQTQYLRHNSVAITPLMMSGVPYGHEIELKRKAGKIKAKYFATGAVYNQFMAWRPYNDVVMVCSGAFTNDYRTPMGITIDNGVLVNKLVDNQMDGLVVVYPNGGIAVSNLEDGNLRYGSPETIANLRSYRDLDGFINWAAQEQATVFQTQLLAYNNELKLDVAKARTGPAERRILVIAKNAFGEVLHIIYNIQTSAYLGDAAAYILKYANGERGLEVVAMLNLDTGGEDILEIYNDYGFKISNPAGKVPMVNAINLVAWAYQEY